jgi:C4-dicarboxylate-specific signal transduction histidine kinase
MVGETEIRGYKTMITERKRLEAQLAQSRKMEAIGHLASGIAHEISTPA